MNNKNYEFNNKKAKVQAKNNIKNKSYNKANTHRIRKNNVKSVIMLQIKNNGKNVFGYNLLCKIINDKSNPVEIQYKKNKEKKE